VVTGASRGIGAGVARRLAAEGAAVALVARTLGKEDEPDGSLSAVRALCEVHGGIVGTVVADLTVDEDRSGVISEAIDILGGPVEILVNNAAAAIPVGLTTITARQQRLQFEANTIAPLLLAQDVLPAMREAGEGWIVNLSSAGASLFPGPPFRPNPVGSSMDVYGASKAGLNKVTNGLAAELFGTGIRVNTIQPRIAVMSEGMRAFADRVGPDVFERLEETVEAIVALCECAVERTGQVIVTLDLLAELALTLRGLDGEDLGESSG
jgi:NAD(P)-dependent dehydrogenase (short-subunit alcohol dehydrogenase family)